MALWMKNACERRGRRCYSYASDSSIFKVFCTLKCIKAPKKRYENYYIYRRLMYKSNKTKCIGHQKKDTYIL